MLNVGNVVEMREFGGDEGIRRRRGNAVEVGECGGGGGMWWRWGNVV